MKDTDAVTDTDAVANMKAVVDDAVADTVSDGELVGPVRCIST